MNESEWVSDIIKIGIPSLVAVVTTTFAFVRELKIRKLQASHDRRIRLLEVDLEDLKEVSNAMTDYFDAWFEVLKEQGRLLNQTSAEKNWKDVEKAWNKFIQAHALSRKVIAQLHVWDAKKTLAILDDLRNDVFLPHYEKVTSFTVMSHEELMDLGDQIGGFRDAFYQKIAIIRKELVSDGE